MTTLTWVTNIPTPYRNHRYRIMADRLPRLGLELEVLYMAWTEQDRPWRYTSADLDHPHRVFEGWSPELSGVPAHVNPALLRHLRANPPDIAVIGGWASPTALLAPWVLPRSTVKILGVETNAQSTVHRRGLRHQAKRLTTVPYDGYMVPTSRSAGFVNALDGGRNRPTAVLPNLVDEHLFRDEVARRRGTDTRFRSGVEPDRPLWILPARLETYKGIDGFLDSMNADLPVHLMIAGEGSMETALRRTITDRRLPVTLLGQLTEDEILDLYAAADLFVLPSLRDDAPLTAMEALAAGLPLMLSDRVGNLEDVLDPKQNGWAIEPDDPAKTATTVTRVAGLNRDQLRKMGRRSAGRYTARFTSETRVDEFAEQLLDIAGRSRRQGTTR